MSDSKKSATQTSELSAVVRAHVDEFVKSQKDQLDGKGIPDEAFDLAGDISKAIANAEGVQLDAAKAKGLVEDVVKREVMSRMDLPGPVLNIVQNILFRTLPRLIGDAATKWFKSMDADNDGVVTREEFARGASAALCCCCASCPACQSAIEACCAFIFPCAKCCCA